MIEKYCAYCKHVNKSPEVKPCSICISRFCNNKPNFELDPVRYFKNMMGSLAKEFGVDVEFCTRRRKDYIYVIAIFSYDGSKSKYSICICDKNNESELMDVIESVRRKLPTLKNPEPVPTFDLSKKPNYSFGIKHAMYESSFGRVTRTYADNRTIPKIKDVKFNGPATIVFWEDGTKTVVKCQEGDTFDPEKGVAMAIVKKVHGDRSRYYGDLIKPWVEKYETDQITSKLTDTENLVNGLVGLGESMKKSLGSFTIKCREVKHG